jgi:hypothetical protein
LKAHIKTRLDYFLKKKGGVKKMKLNFGMQTPAMRIAGAESQNIKNENKSSFVQPNR